MMVSAYGSRLMKNYVSLLHEHADELAANGMEYEEQDRRAEPVTTTLLVSVPVTTFVTTTLSEIIKKIINRLCDRATNSIQHQHDQLHPAARQDCCYRTGRFPNGTLK